jgi:hypothetical protein
MVDEIDWMLTTFEGNRRRQLRALRALPLREKLAVLEDMSEVATRLRSAQSASRDSSHEDSDGHVPPS